MFWICAACSVAWFSAVVKGSAAATTPSFDGLLGHLVPAGQHRLPPGIAGIVVGQRDPLVGCVRNRRAGHCHHPAAVSSSVRVVMSSSLVPILHGPYDAAAGGGARKGRWPQMCCGFRRTSEENPVFMCPDEVQSARTRRTPEGGPMTGSGAAITPAAGRSACRTPLATDAALRRIAAHLAEQVEIGAGSAPSPKTLPRSSRSRMPISAFTTGRAGSSATRSGYAPDGRGGARASTSRRCGMSFFSAAR